MTQDIHQIVIDVVADILAIDQDEVTSTSDLEKLGADQRDMVDIVTELETLLHIELPGWGQWVVVTT